jgi:hypothetical protein
MGNHEVLRFYLSEFPWYVSENYDIMGILLPLSHAFWEGFFLGAILANMGSGELDAGKLQRRFGHMDHQEHTVTGETAFTFVQDPYFSRYHHTWILSSCLLPIYS